MTKTLKEEPKWVRDFNAYDIDEAKKHIKPTKKKRLKITGKGAYDLSKVKLFTK